MEPWVRGGKEPGAEGGTDAGPGGGKEPGAEGGTEARGGSGEYEGRGGMASSSKDISMLSLARASSGYRGAGAGGGAWGGVRGTWLGTWLRGGSAAAAAKAGLSSTKKAGISPVRWVIASCGNRAPAPAGAAEGPLGAGGEY